MNKYARLAMRHWQQTDPERFQAIPESDRAAFFGELGERAESEIQQLQDALAGADPPEETYLEKVGRLNMARLQAEEKVLAELILIPAPCSTEAALDEDWEENEPARRHLELMRELTRLRQEDE